MWIRRCDLCPSVLGWFPGPLLCALLFVAAPSRAAELAGDGLQFFETKIRPILVDSCYKCHSAESEKLKGSLLVDSRDGLLKGGESGKPSVVPGDPEKSLLITAVRYQDQDLQMPPKVKLNDEQIASLVQWIKIGAPDPRTGKAAPVAAKKRVIDIEAGRKHWSFQPLQPVQPPKVRNKSWVRNPIDQFILAKLDEKKIKPNPQADRRTLIRRAYFDLIGLPPTPEEIDAFANDKSRDAWEKVVDHLLASPQYGERWARHWLDLARFGESHGYEQDYDRPFAYTYRDFVIKALNQDVPYKKFVQWQIAGDELEPDNPLAWMATGFLGAGTHATQITANQAEKERYDELDDQISTIGTSMLGLTIGCARCHDHKYDPIPTLDYYRLISTFTTTVRSDHEVDLNAESTRKAEAAWAQGAKQLANAMKDYEQKSNPGLNAQIAALPGLPCPPWLRLELAELKATTSLFFITDQATRRDCGIWQVEFGPGADHTLAFNAKTTLTNLVSLRWDLDAGSRESAFGMPPKEMTIETKAAKGGAKTSIKLKLRPMNESERNRSEIKSLVYDADKPFGFPGGTELAVKVGMAGTIDQTIQYRMLLSVSSIPNVPASGEVLVTTMEFEQAQTAAAAPDTEKSSVAREALAKVCRFTDPEWRKRASSMVDHAWREPRSHLAKAMVCSEGLPAIRLHTQGPDFYEQTFLLKRGDLSQKQSEAPQGFLQVLMRTPDKEKHWQLDPVKDSRTPLRRTAFARWIVDTNNGAGNLVARVIVNRLWQHHFGRGIVASPSDFGATGEKPSHPELLDFLAGELIRNGWKLKSLHKEIMLSACYQQGDAADAARTRVDPEDLLLWRRQPQRLEAEAIRDSILSVSGDLDARMFGPGSLDEGMKRRSIYFTIKRSKLIPMMVQFDWPDSLQGQGRRVNTTVAPQALLMMNNPQVRAAAGDFARRVISGNSDTSKAIQRVYRIALGRLPTASELVDAKAFIEFQSNSYETEKREKPAELAWTDFCQALLSLNEFVYVD